MHFFRGLTYEQDSGMQKIKGLKSATHFNFLVRVVSEWLLATYSLKCSASREL